MWGVDWKVIKYFRKQSCQLQSVAVWARERERESDNNLNTGRVIYFIAAQSCRDVGCEMFVEDLCFYVRLTPIILLYCYCFCPSYICPRSLFWGMMKTMPMSWQCPKQKNIPSRCTFISSAPGGRLKQSCHHWLTICLLVMSVYRMLAMDFSAVLHDLKKNMKSFSNFCNFNSTIF